MAFNSTSNTFSQIANEQTYTSATAASMNASSISAQYDPIYNTLIERIGETMYRKLRVRQNWYNMGTNAPANAYPGILREIAIASRKGINFPADNGSRPTTLNSYTIYDDTLVARYHSCQLRWMFPWTIYDEELREYSGGNGNMIANLTEMKMINAINARNRFMDNLRKKTLSLLKANAATEFATGIDISDFSTLTTDDAKEWLNMIDNLLFELKVGTDQYNGIGEFQQTDKSDLQLVIPREFYKNVMRRAFPDTYHGEEFDGILPDNLILIDTMGDDAVEAIATPGTEVTPTFNSVGMNQLNINLTTQHTVPRDATWQAMIIHKGSMGFEDNLTETLFGTKDIEKLATPVRSHFWTKAYFTDMLPAIWISDN